MYKTTINYHGTLFHDIYFCIVPNSSRVVGLSSCCRCCCSGRQQWFCRTVTTTEAVESEVRIGTDEIGT